MLLKVFKLYKKHKKLSIIIIRESVAVNEEFGSEFKRMDQERFQNLKLLYQFLIEKALIGAEIQFEYFACSFVGILESIVLRRMLLAEAVFNVEEAADRISNYLVKAFSK